MNLQILQEHIGTVILASVIIIIQIAVTIYTMYNIEKVRRFVNKDAVFDFNNEISVKNSNGHFRTFIKRENEYLAIATKTNVDLRLLQDNLNSEQEKMQSSASMLINVPLYIGLVGTFIGIIVGVLGINSNIDLLFETSSIGREITEQTKPITDLFWAVGIAMMASLVGLICMIANTIYYRYACGIFEEGKEKYFKFLRTEVISSLSRKLSFEESTLRLTETARELNKAFSILTSSNTTLQQFQTYTAEISSLAVKVDTTLNKYDEYFRILNGSEARKKWTVIYDALIEDVKAVSDSMQVQFDQMSQHVNQFVITNKEVFDSIQNQNNVLTSLQQYADTQKTVYDNLTTQINLLNQTIITMSGTETQKNQDIIVALQAMTEALKEIKEKK